MAKEENSGDSKNRSMANPGAGGAVYGLGLIGAVVYYLQNSTTLTEGLLGILKALVWPAFVVYKTLEFLKLS